MNDIEALKAILYFSIFKYPITKGEVFDFAQTTKPHDLEKQLDFFVQERVIYKLDNYYSSKNDLSLVERRLKGNEMAKKIMSKADRVARLIAKFPYIESVCLSGALAKGYYDEDGDFDFFIITKPNRLWIARTLLILYKKIFLLNSKKFFCVNYFITSNHLQIQEQNRFTATELVTLVPLYGKDVFINFVRENQWAYEFFPNKKNQDVLQIKDTKKYWLSKISQTVFNTRFGDFLESIFRKMTLKKWKTKFKDLRKKDFDIAMKSTKNVSKHHPQNFQKKVIDQLNKKYAEHEEVIKKFDLEILEHHA